MTLENTSGFGAADSLKELRTGGRGLRDDVKTFVSPVRRHLASARAGIVGRPNALQEHLEGDMPSKAQSAVAIVRIEPVVSGLKRQSGGDEQGFMACAGDLEKNLLLALEQDLAIVNAA